MNGFQEASGEDLSFLTGFCLAVDALPAAIGLIDGPYCMVTKAEIQYCHNLFSRVSGVTFLPRVAHTGTAARLEEVSSLTLDRTQKVEAQFAELCDREDVELVLATSFDFHDLTAFPFDRVAQGFDKRNTTRVLSLPSRSLGGNWLDAYSGVCEVLARELELESGPQDPSSVAIVGHLWDRDEADCVADRVELEALLASLDARLLSLWLGGESPQELARAGRAGTILAMPYARKAAQLLAERTGATLLEVDLPVGLERTGSFLERVGEHLGRGSLAQEVREQEEQKAHQRTRRHIYRFVAGRQASISTSDPHLNSALEGCLNELGLVNADSGTRSHSPRPGEHVVFTNALPQDAGRSAFVPVGYPNFGYHPILPRPLLGYTGFCSLVERVAHAVLRAETFSEAAEKRGNEGWNLYE